MALYRRKISSEIGEIEQFIRRDDRQLIGYEVYGDGTVSEEITMGYESHEQLLSRGYEEIIPED